MVLQLPVYRKHLLEINRRAQQVSAVWKEPDPTWPAMVRIPALAAQARRMCVCLYAQDPDGEKEWEKGDHSTHTGTFSHPLTHVHACGH